MVKIVIGECVYVTHPVYDLYAADCDRNIINIIKKVPHQGNLNGRGYLHCRIRKHGQPGFKDYKVHRFIWECFNGIIPEEKEIDHINNNKEDNHLCNLQLVTHQQNCKISAKNQDYTFVAENHKNRKCVKATNKNTNEVSYFYSLYSVNKHMGINSGTVKMICDGKYGYKSSLSKKDGCSYTFEYIKQDELPDNYKKSANKRPRRVSDENKKKHQLEAMKKWQNKEFKCPNCNKTFKNSYKYLHKKYCKNSQKQ